MKCAVGESQRWRQAWFMNTLSTAAYRVGRERERGSVGKATPARSVGKGKRFPATQREKDSLEYIMGLHTLGTTLPRGDGVPEGHPGAVGSLFSSTTRDKFDSNFGQGRVCYSCFVLRTFNRCCPCFVREILWIRR